MIFLLAWRNSWRNKARSIVIMLSVAIGIFAGMGVLALYKGMMKSRIRTVIDSEVGHLQIQHPEFKNDYHPSYVLPDGNLLLTRVRSLPEVKIAAPRSIVQGMLVTTTSSAGVQINGVVPELEYATSQLKQKIQTGEGFHPEKKNEILIGKKLADKMKLKPGSKLVLTFSDTTDNLVSAAFRVAGIYQSGNAPLDEFNVYLTMQALNELLLTGDSFHQISILLKNDEMLTKAGAQLQQLNPSLLVESWKELSPETDLMVNTVDQYSYIIMLIILIALAFGILNTMLMSVLERTREIGMMVALGTSKSKIFLLVFTETIFLTIAGTPIGLMLSWLVILYFQKHGLDLSGMGEEMLASFGFGTMIYPSFPGEKLFPILMMVIGTAVFSCLLPVIKALRLNPVEALKR
ncbi:ABC transporter permease [Flavihumibacter cheonanensis]|uniref:ABC transporter permease n=1 Tax=Flavihumibacter cheonanensis TaxID=1442385 RepID=UPI001EF7F000|nr:ABC transporter permease [Flavihumibacter cheonanensis]MCG7750917.1 ABC transporter permease [Flavihumibacter cheonanensis]